MLYPDWYLFVLIINLVPFFLPATAAAAAATAKPGPIAEGFSGRFLFLISVTSVTISLALMCLFYFAEDWSAQPATEDWSAAPTAQAGDWGGSTAEWS